MYMKTIINIFMIIILFIIECRKLKKKRIFEKK